MKRKNPTIQSSYGEIFQPDSDIQLRVLALFGMFIAMALILVAEVVMTDDTAMLVLGIVWPVPVLCLACERFCKYIGIAVWPLPSRRKS